MMAFAQTDVVLVAESLTELTLFMQMTSMPMHTEGQRPYTTALTFGGFFFHWLNRFLIIMIISQAGAPLQQVSAANQTPTSFFEIFL